MRVAIDLPNAARLAAFHHPQSSIPIKELLQDRVAIHYNESMTSPPDRVPTDCQTDFSIDEETNWIEPSIRRAFTPPV
jgi:hypothetical protein